MHTDKLSDIKLVCALHTADMFGSARSMLAHIEAVGDVFNGTHVFLSRVGPLEGRLARMGVSYQVVPFVHKGLRRRVPGFSFWRDLKDVIASRHRYFQTVQQFAASQPCLTHVHSSVCVYAMWAAARSGAPLVVHVRETRRPTLESWLREQCMTRLADCIVTVSNAVQRGYSASLRKKARTVYNWVDVPERKIVRPEGRRVIGFIGSIHFEKGIREFLEMCAMLRVRRCRFEAHIYGAPLNQTVDEWCRRFIEQRKLASVVHWRGVADDAGGIFGNIDVCVLPTYYDALPRAVMEAMAWGCPVVATRVGGIPEMLGNEEAGVMVPVRHAEALAHAVEELLRDEPRRRQLGAAGRQRARKLFGRERYRNEMIEMYKDLLERHGHR